MQGALTWLEENQDKPIEELQNTANSTTADVDEDTAAQIAAIEGGETAKSLVCNECGKKFRSPQAAQFHATKTYVFLDL